MKISGAEERMNANRGVFAAAVAETPPQSINSVIQAGRCRGLSHHFDCLFVNSELRKRECFLSYCSVAFDSVF